MNIFRIIRVSRVFMQLMQAVIRLQLTIQGYCHCNRTVSRPHAALPSLGPWRLSQRINQTSAERWADVLRATNTRRIFPQLIKQLRCAVIEWLQSVSRMMGTVTDTNAVTSLRTTSCKADVTESRFWSRRAERHRCRSRHDARRWHQLVLRQLAVADQRPALHAAETELLRPRLACCTAGITQSWYPTDSIYAQCGPWTEGQITAN